MPKLPGSRRAGLGGRHPSRHQRPDTAARSRQCQRQHHGGGDALHKLLADGAETSIVTASIWVANLPTPLPGAVPLVTSTHLLADEHTRVMARALGAGDTLTTALASGPTLVTVFPASNGLADQLKMVTRMVSTVTEVRAGRQVSFVSLGGFDSHADQATVHPALLKIADDRILDQSGLFEN